MKTLNTVTRPKYTHKELSINTIDITIIIRINLKYSL